MVLAAVVLAATAPAAHAGRSTDIALGLASFAVFNQIVAPLLRPGHAEAAYHREVRVIHRPAVIYAPPPAVVYPAPAVVTPAVPSVVEYPHGRYELQVHGHQYVWVWIPKVPPPPPPPPPAPPALNP